MTGAQRRQIERSPASNADPSSSSTRLVDEHTIVITDDVGGKVSDTEALVLSGDPKTLTMTVRVPGRDRPSVLVSSGNRAGSQDSEPRLGYLIARSGAGCGSDPPTVVADARNARAA